MGSDGEREVTLVVVMALWNFFFGVLGLHSLYFSLVVSSFLTVQTRVSD